MAALDVTMAADATAASFPDFLELVSGYLRATTSGGPPGGTLLTLAQNSRDPVDRISRRLATPLRGLDRDRQSALFPPVRAATVRAHDLLAPRQEQMALFQSATPLIPGILGAPKPATYLVLVPNPTEIRPAGGFSGVVGHITLSNGEPKVTFVGETTLKYRDHFEVPKAIGRFLSYPNNSFEIGDAGWDPNFPNSARLAQTMYQSGTGVATDGTLAVDPFTISDLLAVTGPVIVPGFDPFTSTNVVAQFNFIANLDPKHPDGPAALAPVGQAIFAAALAQPPSRWPALTGVLQRAVAGRHLQIYLNDPAAQSLVQDAGASGTVLTRPESADSLLVVDANVGGTKGDAYLTRSMEVKVERYPAGIARHEVVLRYAMPVLTDPVALGLNKHPYRDYLRLYLPETATIRAFNVYPDGQKDDQNKIAEVTLEDGHRVVAGSFQLTPGHSAEVHVYYEVPFGDQSNYRLFIQKQAGIPGLPTKVAISYPGALLTRSVALTEDASFEVRW